MACARRTAAEAALWPAGTGSSGKPLGIMAFILAIILALPIPLGNILPAIALSLFAFALLEKDGLYALAGSMVFLLSIVVVAGVIVALGKAALLLFSISFG